MGRIAVEASALQGEPGDLFCRHLEKGDILFFPVSPLAMPEEDRRFLLAQKQSGASFHKNISYRPLEDRVKGVAEKDPGREERLREIMAGYSKRSAEVVRTLLPAYATGLRLDYASFRPLQEEGRSIKFKARNDLLHVDAFPTRPTRGARILRFFTNINPSESRRWITGEPFRLLVERYAGPGRCPLPTADESFLSKTWRSIASRASAAGLPVADRSRYDEFMLEFHDYLKRNEEFQQKSGQSNWDFPPGSSWMVYTDLVPHAALSGRYALEQTFIVDRSVMVLPDEAPISVLEKACGFPLG